MFNVNGLRSWCPLFCLSGYTAGVLDSFFALLFFVLSGDVVLTISQMCIDGCLVLVIVHISCVV